MPHCLRCHSPLEAAYKACPHCGESITDFVRRYTDESIDGKYKLVQRLGAGGMGEVYKVHHTYLNADRVIKVIRAQISESSEAHERFLREARVATKVQHPNVATLHDFSALPDGSHYMVWEFIDGENLAQVIRRRGVLPPRYSVRLVIEALHGLEAIHRAGIVHRDISPENLMITRDGDDEHLKIIDLGVAKFEDADLVNTKTGIFVGKLRYASPEQIGFLPEGEKIDGRADLYSLAVVLFEMLTGRPPFEATSPHQYLMHHARDTRVETPPLPANLPGGEGLHRVLTRALEKDRTVRYATAREFAAALEAIERTLPDPADMPTRTFDPDATIRYTPPPAEYDTMHRATIRSEVRSSGTTKDAPSAQSFATVATSAPAPLRATTPPPPAPPRTTAPPIATPPPPAREPLPTVIDSSPRPLPEIRQPRNIFAIVALLLGIALAAVVTYLFWPRPATQQPPIAAAKPAGTASAGAQPSSTSVSVVADPATASTSSASTITTSTLPATTTTATAPATTTAAATATHPPATHTNATQPVPQPQPPATQPEPQPSAPVGSGATYVEGRDGDGNDEAIADLVRAMRGATRIAVDGSGGDAELTRQVATLLAKNGITIVQRGERADATIDFAGTVEHLRMGRKRRSAHATIARNGRVVFRYELPPEGYRVGDNPAEAFVRAVGGAFNQ